MLLLRLHSFTELPPILYSLRIDAVVARLVLQHMGNHSIHDVRAIRYHCRTDTFARLLPRASHMNLMLTLMRPFERGHAQVLGVMSKLVQASQGRVFVLTADSSLPHILHPDPYQLPSISRMHEAWTKLIRRPGSVINSLNNLGACS